MAFAMQLSNVCNQCVKPYNSKKKTQETYLIFYLIFFSFMARFLFLDLDTAA